MHALPAHADSLAVHRAHLPTPPLPPRRLARSTAPSRRMKAAGDNYDPAGRLTPESDSPIDALARVRQYQGMRGGRGRVQEGRGIRTRGGHPRANAPQLPGGLRAHGSWRACYAVASALPTPHTQTQSRVPFTPRPALSPQAAMEALAKAAQEASSPTGRLRNTFRAARALRRHGCCVPPLASPLASPLSLCARARVCVRFAPGSASSRFRRPGGSESERERGERERGSREYFRPCRMSCTVIPG